MKNKIYKIFFLFGLGAFLLACEKDDDNITMVAPNTLDSDLSGTTFVLSQDDAEDDFVTLEWTAVDFGTAEVKYSVELDVAVKEFADAIDVVTVSTLTTSITVQQINEALIQLGITPGEAADVKIRVRSWVNYVVDPAISNELALTLTPYMLSFPPIYVIGDAQAWNLGNAVALTSNTPGVYTGKAKFQTNGKFRFFALADWGATQWGWSYFSAGGTIPDQFGNGQDGDSNFIFGGLTTDYNITVTLPTKSITIELAGPPPPPASVFLVTSQTINLNDAVEFPSTSEGVYEKILLVPKNTKFRFFTTKSWTAEKWGWSYFDESLIDSDLGNSDDDVSNFIFLSDPAPEPNTYFKIKVTLADKSITVEPVPPPFPATLLVNGDPFGWNFNNAAYLQKVSVGVYEGIAKVSNGSFRFFGKKDDWGSGYGYDKFTTIPGTFGDGGGGDRNFTYSGATRYYKFTVSLINKTITISDPSLLVVGEAGDGANWNFGAAPVLTWVSGGTFTATANFTNGDDFRFFNYPDWSLTGNEYNFNYFTTVDTELNVSGGDANFNFNGTTGSHTLTVDLIAKTVDIN